MLPQSTTPVTALCACGCGQSFIPKKQYSPPRMTRYILGSHASQPTPLIERFWSKVSKSDGCWLWTGSHTKAGYGNIGGERNSTNRYAHRVSWEIHFGPIPDGMEVCHSCDNPPCCNPSHLFLGSHADNMADRDAKGRDNHARGAAAGRAKLTEDQVVEMRRLYATGRYSQSALGRMYDIDISSARKTIIRQYWKHVA